MKKTNAVFTICPMCETMYAKEVQVCAICRYEEAVLLTANSQN